MIPIDQVPRNDRAENRTPIRQTDRHGPRDRREPDLTRKTRHVKRRHEIPQPLHDVPALEDPERARSQEARLDPLRAHGGVLHRQPPLEAEDGGHGQDEGRDGPDAEGGAEAPDAQDPGEGQRERDARCAGAGPDDAVGEAFAGEEPFVEVEEGGAL